MLFEGAMDIFCLFFITFFLFHLDINLGCQFRPSGSHTFSHNTARI
jgi:hypothetical protein